MAKPSFAKGGDTQNNGLARADELTELRAQLVELNRKTASPASAPRGKAT